jgi:CRP-like cAMP-binding protein
MSPAEPAEALRLFLARLMARSPLGAEDQKTVLGLPCTVRHFAAHREIVQLGQQVEHAGLVADGFVARFGQTEEGQRQFFSFHIPGDFADLYSLMVPTAPSALQALTATTILQVPHSALRSAAARCPAVGAAMWRDCVIDNLSLSQWLMNVGRRDARSRLAHLLCELALRFDFIGRGSRQGFSLPMTQEHLADALGLTPVHVNRTLKALREDGVVTLARGRVHIHDWEMLAASAQFDPLYLQLPSPSCHCAKGRGC